MSAYVPSAVSNAAINESQNFFKEFEDKNGFLNAFDTSSTGNFNDDITVRDRGSDKEPVIKLNNEKNSAKRSALDDEKPRELKPDKEVDTKRPEKVSDNDKTPRDKIIQEKNAQQNSSAGQDKKIEQEGKNGNDSKTGGVDKTGSEGETATEAKKQQDGEAGNIPKVNRGEKFTEIKEGEHSEKNEPKESKKDIKEALKTNQVNTEEMVKTKKDGKTNFSDLQKTALGKNSDKVALKETGDAKGEAKKGDSESSAFKDRTEDFKTSEEHNLEKNLVNEINTEKKTDKPTATFKHELLARKNETKADNNPVNGAEIHAKEVRQVNDIKLKKILGHNNMAEQYHALKDKVLSNVENSIKFLISEGENKVSINLRPPELGKVQVELTVKDNQVSAKINAENIAVKEVLLANLDQLKANIENNGVSINKIEVEVGGFNNHFEGQFNNGNSDSKKGGKGGGKGENGGGKLLEKDWLPNKVIKQQALSFFLGSSINYLV
ncbi:MAG: hypothetical protein GY757_04080 [bacterium]|nr:hypothetical protein [bacterium]